MVEPGREDTGSWGGTRERGYWVLGGRRVLSLREGEHWVLGQTLIILCCRIILLVPLLVDRGVIMMTMAGVN
jgi:hypothetical protein